VSRKPSIGKSRGMPFSGSRWQRLAKGAAVVAAIGGVAVGLFISSGIYNVAASTDHWAITTWILERVRVQSVRTWSSFVEEPPPLDDESLVVLGAAHFEGGCTPCHGRPGEPINAIVGAMLPPPPALHEAVVGQSVKELFWIVKHGLKYTAMPAWPAQRRDDEVWSLTAFLRQLPDLTPQRYREISGAVRAERTTMRGAALAASSEAVALTQCIRCHGGGSTPPLGSLVPRLDGQPQAYLERALTEYSAGRRPSGIMQPVADLLDEEELRLVAAYYAELSPQTFASTAPAAHVARGGMLALRGSRESAVPPCLACHSAQHPEMFPALAGQSFAYLANQLRVFKRGARNETAYAEIMTIVARRLTDEQIEDLAAYFASLPPGGAPVLSGTVR
jgi:cytochrome c553